MRFVKVVILLILINLKINVAQNMAKSGFGIANIDELKMQVSALDSSADAEILIDKEQIMIVSSKQLMVKTVYHGKIKILKKSGLDRGTIKLRCVVDETDKEYINNIKGFTHNLENGTPVTTPLTDASIFYEKLDENNTITKIIAPNLKVGSVFEYQYTRNTPFSINPNPPLWRFQSSVPSRWSEVIAYIPAWFFYKTHHNGFLPFAINEIKDTTLFFDESYIPGVICRYAIKDIPALKEEIYTPSLKDCSANLEFELSGYQQRNGHVRYFSATWKDVYRFLKTDENFGERLKNTAFFEPIAKQFQSIKDTLDLVNAIYKFITKEVKWNGDLGLGAGSLYKAYEKKSASGTELNMMLVALLRICEVKANMAALSTRANGKLNVNIARTDRFNHAVAHVKIEGKDIFMDASEKYAKPGMLPFYSASNHIFILEPDSGRMANYKPKDKRWSLETINYTVDIAKNELKANYEIVHGGYEAIELKTTIDEKGKDELLKAIVQNNSDWQVEDLALDYKNRDDGAVQIKYSFAGALNQQANNNLHFNPLHELRLMKSPFEAQQRIYPIDFITPIEKISMIKIQAPDGYEFVDLPGSQSFALPEKAGKFSYSVELKDKELNIRSHLTVSNTFFNPEQYDQMREFFGLVVQNQAQLIVLKKLP